MAKANKFLKHPWNDMVKQHRKLMLRYRVCKDKEGPAGIGLGNRILALREKMDKYKQDHPLEFIGN